MAAHQGREQGTFDFAAEPKRLVGIADTVVIKPVRWVESKIAHLIDHALDAFACPKIDRAGDLSIVAWIAFVPVKPAFMFGCDLPDSNRYRCCGVTRFNNCGMPVELKPKATQDAGSNELSTRAAECHLVLVHVGTVRDVFHLVSSLDSEAVLVWDLLSVGHPALIQVLINLISVDVLPQLNVLLNACSVVIDVHYDVAGFKLQDADDVPALPDR